MKETFQFNFKTANEGKFDNLFQYSQKIIN